MTKPRKRFEVVLHIGTAHGSIPMPPVASEETIQFALGFIGTALREMYATQMLRDTLAERGDR